MSLALVTATNAQIPGVLTISDVTVQGIYYDSFNVNNGRRRLLQVPDLCSKHVLQMWHTCSTTPGHRLLQPCPRRLSLRHMRACWEC